MTGKRLRMGLSGLLAAALLAGCALFGSGGGAPADEAPTQAPTGNGPPEQTVIAATGSLAPTRWATLSFTLGGTVAEVLVEEGDEVEAGDVIARLDSADLDVELMQAEAQLTQAEAQLTKVEAGPSEETVTAAEQSLLAAQRRLGAAVARRDALYTQVSEADIEQAENSLYKAQIQFKDARGALNVMEEFDPDRCENYENQGLTCPIAAWGQIDAQYRIATLQMEAAQAHLDDLLNGPDENQLALANAQIWLSQAQVKAAEARLDLLEGQPFPEQVAVAQAEVDKAQVNVDAVESRLAQMTLTAPYDGTIANVAVKPGVLIGPGQEVAQIGDLSTMRVTTTDLNEIDVARVEVGDPVEVTFDALPDVRVEGTVTRIAPKTDPGAGANYAVTIELDEIPDAARWGMTAFVDIDVE